MWCWTYLEESMKSRLQLLTPDDGLLAHLKEVDEGRIGLEQLPGLEEKGKEVEGGQRATARDLDHTPQIDCSRMTLHFTLPNHRRA